jgi:hypothetical protein
MKPIPQDSRNRRRVLPSTRRRVTRLGRDRTASPPNHRMGSPRTTGLDPGGPGPSLSYPASASGPAGGKASARGALAGASRSDATGCFGMRLAKTYGEVGKLIIKAHYEWNRHAS